jgi:hypothetical protein
MDAGRFRSVEDATLSIDTLINSARRDKAAELQSWIDSEDPPPLAILRRIAVCSPPHSRVLALIADELLRFSAADLREPLADVDADAADELTSVTVRTHDLTRHAEELLHEADVLRAQIASAAEQRDKARTEWEKYKRIVDAATFRDVGEAAATEERPDAAGRDAAVYNELWAENRYLRGEIGKVEGQIEEHRKYHREYTARMALAAYEAQTAEREGNE